VHGLLHLLGFDHADPDERREMFSLQRTLLLTFLAGRERQGEDVRIIPPTGE
jgi:probable rRNA maturation factor